MGDEGLRMAEAAAHPVTLMLASWGCGLLALRQGDLPRALPLLERAVHICRDADLPAYFPRVAAALGEAYTLAGRAADAVPLLTQALEQATATKRVSDQALSSLCLGEALALDGRMEEAHSFAEGALTLARAHQEQGHEAYALRVLGDMAARREPPEIERAEAHYRQALTLAEELGMRPLVAHCHLGLGTLYGKIGRAGAGAHRTVHRHRAVPRHGDDLLAAPGGGGAGPGGGAVMDFYAVVDQVIELLREPRAGVLPGASGAVQLDDDAVEALKDELIDAQHVAVDEDGRVLVWTGDTGATPAPRSCPKPIRTT